MSDQFIMNGKVYNATHHDVEYDDEGYSEDNTAKSISFFEYLNVTIVFFIM